MGTCAWGALGNPLRPNLLLSLSRSRAAEAVLDRLRAERDLVQEVHAAVVHALDKDLTRLGVGQQIEQLQRRRAHRFRFAVRDDVEPVGRATTRSVRNGGGASIVVEPPLQTIDLHVPTEHVVDERPLARQSQGPFVDILQTVSVRER